MPSIAIAFPENLNSLTSVKNTLKMCTVVLCPHSEHVLRQLHRFLLQIQDFMNTMTAFNQVPFTIEHNVFNSKLIQLASDPSLVHENFDLHCG